MELSFNFGRNFRPAVLEEKLPSLINDDAYAKLRTYSSRLFIAFMSGYPFAVGLVADLVSTLFKRRDLRTSKEYQKAIIALYSRAYTNGFS